MNTNRLQMLPLVALIALSMSAIADDQLDRFEAISERSHDIVMKMMVREYGAMGADTEALHAAIPDGDWNDAYREAGQCMLDRYSAIIGSSGVDTMLAEMETLFDSLDAGSATLESMAELNELNAIEGVSTEQQLAITQECGFVELSMERMRESGFLDIVEAQLMQGSGG
jgi:hypothetical protein